MSDRSVSTESVPDSPVTSGLAAAVSVDSAVSSNLSDLMRNAVVMFEARTTPVRSTVLRTTNAPNASEGDK
jgi:hypothetical protein